LSLANDEPISLGRLHAAEVSLHEQAISDHLTCVHGIMHCNVTHRIKISAEVGWKRGVANGAATTVAQCFRTNAERKKSPTMGQDGFEMSSR
jgi:hypothetical protein